MSFRMVASANGVISVVTGLVALVVPGTLAAIYGEALSEREAALVQMVGAAYLGIGLVSWLLRDSADEYTRRGFAIGALASWAVSLVLTFVSLRLATGPSAWGNVALQAAFTLAWVYVLLNLRNAPRTVGA